MRDNLGFCMPLSFIYHWINKLGWVPNFVAGDRHFLKVSWTGISIVDASVKTTSGTELIPPCSVCQHKKRTMGIFEHEKNAVICS